MAKKLLYVIVVLCLLFPGFQSFAQDPEFSQFYANPLYLNPAFAGTTYCGRLTLNYRNQWPSISKGYVTYDAAYDQYLEKINSGYGLVFMGDRQGDGALSTMLISALYSYKLRVSNSFNVDFGAQGTYGQIKMDWNKYIFGDMIDPNTGATTNPTQESEADWNKNKSYVDFSAGLVAGYQDKIFGGIAVHHLNEPDNGLHIQSTSTLPMKITVHAGTEFNLSSVRFGSGENDEFTISPNILYQQQDKFHQLNVGMYGKAYPFIGGLWFRHNFENPDAVIVLLGFKQQSYQLGYSFDFTVSKLGISSGGAHEVSFMWEFCIYKEDYKKRRIRTITSPTF
jgi:type IX secretion system PorP/SprF family membrane protein